MLQQGWFRIVRIFGIVLATAIACLAIIYFSIPMSDTRRQQFDVIVVLGCPANPDGSIGPIAKSRVLEGIREYRAGIAPRLLMTGGAVENQFVEAQVMMHFALSQGVPAYAVLAAGDSKNTLQNAYYSYRIMQAHDWTSVLVVSSPSHLRRASLIFRNYPLAWRMQAAPWPPDYILWKRVWFWSSEVAYTCYLRLLGFPDSQRYFPQTHFIPPRL